MNVRDLNQYIENLCGEVTLDKLGTNKELLLQKIYGQDPSPDQVKSVISDAASFASNAEEQLFYEFVQNAYDADADSLFFYANNDYLVVLNNGLPFYTDFDIFDSESIREGQLYNFLAKGKSLKRSDESKLGKYGQGSKLLYTLITDVSESEGNEELLIDALFNKKKGPYLISWYNYTQLSNLLLNKPVWMQAKGDDYQNNILFAKILMSYYPLSPGVNEVLFSTQEAIDAVNAFDSLVDPRRNIHYLQRGTALIIPLGNGKYERIMSKANLERVRTRLGGFASITKDQERNEGKSVDRILVMGEEVEQHEVKSVIVEFEIEGKPFHYHFAFNPVFAEKNFVNLFKGLPILETKLRLGFIIDSQKFDVDSSRQRISDKAKTQVQLERAFSELLILLKDLKQDNPEKFEYIYQSLASTRIPDGEDYLYIRNSFRSVFKSFFEKNVLTIDGSFEEKDNVRTCPEAHLIPLSTIGICKYKWINEDIKPHLHRHSVDVQSVEFSDILSDADSDKIQTWIKGLPINLYSEFHVFLDSHKTDRGVNTYGLFRSNKGNLFSLSELQSTANVFYSIGDNMPFGECEHIICPLSNISLSDYLSILFSKIKTNIVSFRETDSTKDDAANLLAWISSKDTTYVSRIKNEITLLPNMHDEYCSFSNLFEIRPAETILFDNYCVKGHVPQAVIDGQWLLSPERTIKRCWLWIVNHWQQLQDNEEWGAYTLKYISDVKSVFNKVNDEQIAKSKLSLYLDDEGKPIKELRTIVNNASRLTEKEYLYLGSKVMHLSLLPYSYYKELLESPFQVETIQSANIVQEGLTADRELLRIIIKITDGYLNLYRTQEVNDQYLITKTSSGFNYIDSVSPDLQGELLNAQFYRIPSYVQDLLKTERGKYRFASNETMLLKAIERINTPIKLLPFVKNANATVVNSFFNQLKQIDINGKISKEDLAWQVIEFAVQRTTENNDFIAKVFEQIRHNNLRLPESITKQNITIDSNSYCVYDLDESYKTDNHTIDTFFTCLPSQREIEFFKLHYYDGREVEVSTEVLFNDIHNRKLTIEQLRFCINYSIANDLNNISLQIGDGISLSKALDMVLKYDFNGFDKYFKMPGVDFNRQIYANKEILNDDEYLPTELHKWLDKNPSAFSLFTQLTTVDSPYVRVRQLLLDNEKCEDILAFAEEKNKNEINAMFSWAINKKLDIAYETERYNTIMSILQQLPKDFGTIPLLKYTGTVAIDKQDKPKPKFILEWCQDDCVFLSINEWGNQFDKLRRSHKLARTIKEHTVYAFEKSDLLYNQGIDHFPQWRIQAGVDAKLFPEYNDQVYKQWKAMEASKQITIHVSEKPIVMSFSIVSSNECVFSEKLRDSEYGYEKGKRVIIQQPNSENLSLMKTIAKHISSMAWFKEPFIALQALYVEKWEDAEGKSNLNLSNSHLNEEQAQETLDKISSETANNLDQVNKLTQQMDGEDIDKLNDSVNQIKELLNTLDPDELRRIADKKDQIMQILDDLNEAEEEDKESQVRQTIGFIGELIYSHYLENKGKDFVHAALNGVGEYDFENKTDNIFIDVKTTLYSLRDGTAPFYLHRSQNEFMKNHPDSKYHIVRISLIDLNLKKSYEELRDTYGKDANPMENKQLRKRCEQVAKRYWKGAKIEEFDASSPEYIIRIEQKK